MSISLEITADHAVPVEPLGGTATVQVQSGGTVFYADNPQVSSSNNQGSITAGSSLSFTTQAWIISTTLATVLVTQTNSVPSSVTADATVPDGVSDNTAYLQARISAAASLGISLRIPPATWVINKLQLPSNTTVDATGATFVQPNGVNTRMILNPSLLQGTPGTTRDKNISWTGGTFLKGAGQTNVGKFSTSPTGLDDHCTMFGFVDGLNVKNFTVTQTGTGGDAGTGGRYGCYVWNCTNFFFENYTATSVSGAVNQSTLQLAYCQNGHIKGVFGSDGDDAVALVNGNQVGDMLANGLSHMENVTVEDVFGSAPSNGVRIMPGSTAGGAPFFNVQHCSVRNVRVSAGARGTSAAVYVGGAASGYPNLQNGTVQDVEISDIKQLRASTPAVWIDGWSELFVTLRRINNLEDSTIVNIPLGTGHQRVKVTDCVFNTTITAGSQYPISCASSSCRSIELDNIQFQAATTGTATVGIVNGTAGPGWIVANNIRTTGKCFALGTFAATTRIVANGINGEDANGLGHFQTNTGAVVTVRGWNGCFSAGADSFSQVAGSVATNDSRLPGAHGSATLVAGTVVVNTGTGMATAASVIRLTNVSAGGTLGDHSVARGANTFTINSNNAADTSVIYWEIASS